LLRQLIIEIEPNIEELVGKIELSQDNSLGMRYSNIVTIINALQAYFEKSTEKYRFNTSKTDIKSVLKINELLKNDKSQLILLGEILLFLSTISSKVDYWIDKLGDNDEKLMNNYCSIADKYLQNRDSLEGHFNTNYNNYMTHRNSDTGLHQISGLKKENEKIQKKYEELENEKLELIKSLSEMQKEVQMCKEKLKISERNYIDLEFKYKDSIREIEIIKNSNKSNLLAQEELLQDTIRADTLKNQLQRKEMEIEDIKKENAILVRGHVEEIRKLNEKLEFFQDKVSSFKSLTTENEKLKVKLKELQALKEQKIENEDMNLTLESKQRMIDTLIKEKQINMNEIEALNKELRNEKDKVRQLILEKKKIEEKANELENQLSIVNTERDELRQSVYNSNAFLPLQALDSKRGSTEGIYGIKSPFNACLSELEQSNYLNEMEKIKEERIKFQFTEKEVKDLKYQLDSIKNNSNNNKFFVNTHNLGTNQKEKEINSLREEVENYKKMNEELKARVDVEHELISSSMYELAIQYYNLRKEFEKRNSTNSNLTQINNQNKTWLELERMKNFPLDK
jgi:hypothetical protein